MKSNSDILQWFAQGQGDAPSSAEAPVDVGQSVQNTENVSQDDELSDDAQEENANSVQREFEQLITGKYAEAFENKLREMRESTPEERPVLTENEEKCSADNFEQEKEIRLDSDTEQIKRELVEKLKTARNKKIIAGWEHEAQALKNLYPAFSLPEEMRNNSRFASLIKAGVDVKSAYETANLNKILTCAMRYASLTAGKKAALAISRQSTRPRENSVLDRASSIAHTDVQSLTEKDIRTILAKVSRGAKITF